MFIGARFCLSFDSFKQSFARMGNLVFDDSGCDKQMLCGSSGSRAAPITLAVKKKKSHKNQLSLSVVT